MRSLQWSSALELGSPEVDEQHKMLIDIANDFLHAVREGEGSENVQETFKRLREYTVTHFYDEEQFMGRMNYPGLKDHQVQHTLIIQQVKAYQRRLYEGEVTSVEEMLDFLKKWLVEHIVQQDLKLKQHLESMKEADLFAQKET
jgi:hemerythrin-like metal-binding protein